MSASSRIMRWACACLMAVLAQAAISNAQAQSALRSLAEPRSMYQERAERISAGDAPPLFTGSASVAPRKGFPWMVSLQVKGARPEQGHFCGGVLVAPSWVLTAAHCVTEASARGVYQIVALTAGVLQALVGSNVLSRGGRSVPIEQIVVHPNYQVTSKRVPESDLALLKLSEAVADVRPVDILPGEHVAKVLDEGSKVRIFGWGTASFNINGPVSNNLLYAFVDVIARSRCNEPAVYDGAVTDTMFCAGLGFADACQGDSGGPAIGYVRGEKYLVGITSWGVGCGNVRYPGVYVDVSKFARWISDTVAAPK